MPKDAFYAFPGHERLKDIISRAVSRAQNLDAELEIVQWPEMDIAGAFIGSEVTNWIDETSVTLADITYLNFNVFYEIGYAVGRHRTVIPTLCTSLANDHRWLSRLGLLDTIGRIEYDNSDELAEKLTNAIAKKPINFLAQELNFSKPIFLLEPRKKGESTVEITRALRKSSLNFRSYDPAEEPRLSLNYAYTNTQQSIAIVVHLLSTHEVDHEDHNLRAAFLIGLSHGMKKHVLALQRRGGIVPLDYRDFVTEYDDEKSLEHHIGTLAPYILRNLQSGPSIHIPGQRTLLEQLDLGSPSAENETEKLRSYYLETDQARRVKSGTVRLVVGRKGTGKSALFFHANDQLQQDVRNLVLSLRPDGAQLRRIKEIIIRTVDDPAKEHVSTALWEYVLILETLRSYLEKDKQEHINNHNITEPYRDLEKVLAHHGGDDAVDFTDLVGMLIERLAERLPSDRSDRLLSSSELTRALYAADLAQLRDRLLEYSQLRSRRIWILLDNLDAGWPTHGVEIDDIVLLRGLIEALQKLERFFERGDVRFCGTVFIRNDVYDYLIDNTPDRGKASKAVLDWTDPNLLKEMLKKRLCYEGGLSLDQSFNEIWRQLSTSSVNNRDSADYLIELSMMRPRNLISLVSYARSNSINLNHRLITEADILSAARAYSADVTREVGFELRDIYPEADDIFYVFLECKSPITVLNATMLLKEEVDAADPAEIIELLIWFGFFGVRASKSELDKEAVYIYELDYDIKKTLYKAENLDNPETLLYINPAFWPFLEITCSS